MRIGEIIETTSTSIVAESDALNQAPPLGALCEINVSDARTLFAVVAFGRTAGLDPSRRAVRRGNGEVSDAAIYDHHPELLRILRTEFDAALVGYAEGGRLWQRLPAQPPPLHYSIHLCSNDTIARFSDQLSYFRLLLNSSAELPADQLVAANVREVYRARGNDVLWLERAAREVASLMKNDYERLMSVLLAIEP